MIRIRLLLALEDIRDSYERYVSRCVSSGVEAVKFSELIIALATERGQWGIDADYLSFDEERDVFFFHLERVSCREEVVFKYYIHTFEEWIEPTHHSFIHDHLNPIAQVEYNEHGSFNNVIRVPSVTNGEHLPHGLSLSHDCSRVNFSVYATNVIKVSLCIYSSSPYKSFKPLVEISMCKTENSWHVESDCSTIPQSFLYMYRLKDKRGSITYVADPYGAIIDGGTAEEWGHVKREVPKREFFSRFTHPAATTPFDWEGDGTLNTPLEDLVIYEVHVRGFTMSVATPEAAVDHTKLCGTYLGLASKAPYLKSLGITAVELLPVFEFDETQCCAVSPSDGAPLTNFWGYSTVSFFAPMSRYTSPGGDPVVEFKTMVKCLHKCGIEVILDVVYNHVDLLKSPFDKLSRDSYFILDGDEHTNYTGCGNTLACNNKVTLDLISSSLRYWVEEMHVDGFRFDLASVLCRSGASGEPLNYPPIIQALSADPVLQHTKLIAEPWDCGNLYKVGSFPCGYRWMEWNDTFRDNARQFIRGDANTQGGICYSIAGSPHLYNKSSRNYNPNLSVNFITAHDGFTLRDLFTYSTKHNYDNGEDNRDGSDNNLSCNYGIEGPVGEDSNPQLHHLRMQQIKNSILLLSISRGVPMIVSGDEYGKSTNGNNNMWNQDTSLNYFDWSSVDKVPLSPGDYEDEVKTPTSTSESILLFAKKALSLRKSFRSLHSTSFGIGNGSKWEADDSINVDEAAAEERLEEAATDKVSTEKGDTPDPGPQYCEANSDRMVFFNSDASYAAKDGSSGNGCSNLHLSFNHPHFIGVMVHGSQHEIIYTAFNPCNHDVEVALPVDETREWEQVWRVFLDSSRPETHSLSTNTLPREGTADGGIIYNKRYLMRPYSSIVLIATTL